MTVSSRWARCWSVMAALGIGLAVLEWSALIAAVILASVAACVATVLALLPSPRDGRHTLVLSLTAAAWFEALLALVSSSPSLALLVVLVLTASSPPVLRLLRRRPAVRPAPRTVQPTESLPSRREPEAARQVGRVRAVQELDDSQLCTLWRRLFWQLVDQSSTEAVLSTVAWRQACLDELERRDPAAVRAWFDSGARAAGGPERFLTRHGHPGGADAA